MIIIVIISMATIIVITIVITFIIITNTNIRNNGCDISCLPTLPSLVTVEENETLLAGETEDAKDAEGEKAEEIELFIDIVESWQKRKKIR